MHCATHRNISKFEYPLVVTCFEAKTKALASPAGTPKKEESKPQLRELVDGKRVFNIGIALKKLKGLRNEEIRDAILRLDTGVITESIVETLRAVLPRSRCNPFPFESHRYVVVLLFH